MMNVGFIFSSQNVLFTHKPLQCQEEMAFGISYISALLQRSGHKTRLCILTKETSQKSVEEFIESFQPRVLAFTAVASEYSFIARWADMIKRRFPSIYLIGGGCHVSLNPDQGISSAFDAICVGEGEYPVLELVQQIEAQKRPSAIANLWIKQKDLIEKNPPRPFLEDLDSLPFPDREMWQDWVSDPQSRPVILLGRGCHFQCTYCCNHALQKLARGKYVRFRSPENIIRELEGLAEKHKALSEVYFEVETLATNISWALRFCDALSKFNARRQKPLSFGANLRVTPRADFGLLFRAMRKSNFTFINIGLESGSERVRREIMRRYYSNQDVIETVQKARQHGLKVHLLNMIGLPGETEEDIKETIRVNRLCQPDMWASHSIFFPYPGTEIHKLCSDKGFLPKVIDQERERSRAVLDLPDLSKKKIEHYFIWFDYYVYKGYRPVWKLLMRTFIARLHASYSLMRLYRMISEMKWLKKLKTIVKSNQ